MEVPSELAVTAYDVKQHLVVAELAEGRSELTGLALWIMAERGAASPNAEFLQTLPVWRRPGKFAQTCLTSRPQE
eukprot:jgi/Tetstr1/437844/TSEL_026484.t1